MSSLSGIIDCKSRKGTHEELCLLGGKSNRSEKFTEIGNRYGTYVGLFGNGHDIIYKGIRYTYLFTGKLSNKRELSDAIASELGLRPAYDMCDADLAVWAYILYGGYSPRMLHGSFAYVIYSEGISDNSASTPKIFFARDRFGICSLYYRNEENTKLSFSCDLKDLLRTYKCCMNAFSIYQIFFLDGATLPGYTSIDGIYEIEPGYCAYADCRDTCKLIKKCYCEAKREADTDSAIDRYIGYCKSNDHTHLDISNKYLYDDCIEESVMATASTALPRIHASIKAMSDRENICYTGADMLFRTAKERRKGFFPWIVDPYREFDILKSDLFSIKEGFDMIDPIRVSKTPVKQNGYLCRSLLKFYMPMTLKYVAASAQSLGTNISFPLCECDLYDHLYRCGNDENRLFKYACDDIYIKEDKKTDPNFEAHIRNKLLDVLNNSGSVLNFISDKVNVIRATELSEDTEALCLLYAIHCFTEFFSVDLSI